MQEQYLDNIVTTTTQQHFSSSISAAPFNKQSYFFDKLLIKATMDSSEIQTESADTAATGVAAAPVKLVAKWGKQRIEITLSVVDTIGTVKQRLQDETGVLEKRQKLIGLVAIKGGAKAVTDDLVLGDLKVKKKKGDDDGPVVHEFIMMGTAEKDIFVDPSEKDDLPEVVDDFELDFNVSGWDVLESLWFLCAVQCPVRFSFCFHLIFCFAGRQQRMAESRGQW